MTGIMEGVGRLDSAPRYVQMQRINNLNPENSKGKIASQTGVDVQIGLTGVYLQDERRHADTDHFIMHLPQSTPESTHLFRG